jgi:dihydroorotase
MKLVLSNARLIDPEGDRMFDGGLVIAEGRIAEVFEGPRPGGFDCDGACLAPGIVDVGVKVGEPGERHKESFRTAGAAAAAGGVTTMVTRPDTEPPSTSPSGSPSSCAARSTRARSASCRWRR